MIIPKKSLKFKVQNKEYKEKGRVHKSKGR